MKEPYKINALEQAVMLAVIYTGDKASAPNIRKCISARCHWQVHSSTLYSALETLKKRELLCAQTRQARSISRAIKPMRFYRVTKKGENSLNRAKQITECMWEGAQLVAQAAVN